MLGFKKVWFLFLPVFLSLFLFTTGQSQAQTDSSPKRFIIKYKNQTSSQTKDSIKKTYQARLEQKLEHLNAESITTDASNLQKIRSHPRVEYIEPDFKATKTEIPNDPSFNSQWGLSKINASGAWDITHGSTNVKVAVVDTGINTSNPDLSNKVDLQANFTTDPLGDGDGHGTHVAGIIAASTNNSVGIAGTGYNTRLLSVKVLDNTGSGYYSWIANGIIWASDNGAKVINLSLGGT